MVMFMAGRLCCGRAEFCSACFVVLALRKGRLVYCLLRCVGAAESRVVYCLLRCVGAAEGRDVYCLLRCVYAAEVPSCGLLASSCVVVRVGRSVLGRWEGRSTWISSGIWMCRASLAWVSRVSLVSTCRLLRIIFVSEAENVTSG